MKRQGPRQLLRFLKAKARDNLFTYSQHAFEAMVDASMYEEDVKRAFSNAILIDVREKPRAGTHYVLRGFGMNEEPLILVCRQLRRLVEVVDLYWD